MKLTRRTNYLGFSLIELMVVIAIIAILAGLMTAAMPGIQTRVNRNNTQAFLAELESGLDAYQIENGIFPQNKGSGDRLKDGIKGSSILYKHLSGDYDLDGFVDTTDDTRIYVERLDWGSNKKKTKAPRSYEGNAGEYYVIDTFASPVFYLADPPNIAPEERKTYNPTFDLWSTAGNDGEKFSDQAGWITNWQSR